MMNMMSEKRTKAVIPRRLRLIKKNIFIVDFLILVKNSLGIKEQNDGEHDEKLHFTCHRPGPIHA